MEAAIAPHAQADSRTDGGMFSEPARTDPQTAIIMAFLPHDQLQQAILRDRGNRIFAHVQRDKRIYQGLGVHAITLGDHIYKRKEIASVLDSKDNIVKLANFPPSAPPFFR